ncbi:hypothetical protein DPMN_100327 [Dreissena polymorpha]|uniref:Uncharacterized protein n=1 Tax=Dreissena polymorpha TaxID=45954 RepID=A0A9D4R926_DREPO|nr:hypothetical protein DPMN_100327 [Dreissena polymorpha]
MYVSARNDNSAWRLLLLKTDALGQCTNNDGATLSNPKMSNSLYLCDGALPMKLPRGW